MAVRGRLVYGRLDEPAVQRDAADDAGAVDDGGLRLVIQRHPEELEHPAIARLRRLGEVVIDDCGDVLAAEGGDEALYLLAVADYLGVQQASRKMGRPGNRPVIAAQGLRLQRAFDAGAVLVAADQELVV